MKFFTREFAAALADQMDGEGYRMFVVLGMREDDAANDGADIDVTVVGGREPQDLDDLEDAFEQLVDSLRQNIKFRKPMGSA